MSKQDRLAAVRRIIETGIVAVVRLEDTPGLIRAAEAIEAGGIDVIEFTMTTPGALRTIEEATSKLGDRVLLGAGTVLDPETARSAILAGARFVVAPTLSTRVIEICHRYDVPIIPGVMTPTEMLAGWDAGADLLKLFPAGVVGPQYIKDVLAPLPQLRILPTGGVNLENAGAFIRAGAAAVAVGSNLVNPRLVAAGEFGRMTEVAHRLMEEVRTARRDPKE